MNTQRFTSTFDIWTRGWHGFLVFYLAVTVFSIVGKELAHDYLDLDSGANEQATANEQLDDSPEAIQAWAREAWAAARAKDLQSGTSTEDIQRLARERW
jgi:cell division protein FtsB